MDFKTKLTQTAERVDNIVRDILSERELNDDLRKAMEYTLFAGGKRIRGSIVLWACELICGEVNRKAEAAAAAIEMVHTYSLVHDDLPAMDDDDLRRGKPTCHKAFDEATAILTGDALLTVAFEVLAKEIEGAETAVKIIGQLAESAGGAGMIAGQMADLKGEHSEGTTEQLEYIHINKTAKMFQCSAVCGAIAGGASTLQLRSLWEYGLNLGLAFQVADDIMDVCSDSEQMGKTAGKDEKATKCTHPAIFGLQRSKLLEQELARKSVAALEDFGPEAELLRELPIALLERVK